jgi:N-acetyl-alpha-D-muramate 1-phosphate uridylyltransferase
VNDAGPSRTPEPAVRTDLAGVVLAAGLGTRLRPLTDLRPKALCPVGGVPLVDLALDRLSACLVPSVAPPEPHCSSRAGPEPVPGGSTGAKWLLGSNQLAVNAHHHAEQVARHLAGRAHVSVEQPVPLGTAGALARLRPWLDGRDVLLTNADAYLPDGLGELMSGWDRERCRLLVRALPDDIRADFHPSGRPVRYVGACLLPWHLVAALREEPSGLYEVLWRGQDEKGRLDLVTTNGTTIDCGTPADYLAANLHASGGRSVVGQGAVVEGTLERCVVWDGAFVGAAEHLVEAVRAGTRDAPVTVDCR